MTITVLYIKSTFSKFPYLRALKATVGQYLFFSLGFNFSKAKLLLWLIGLVKVKHVSSVNGIAFKNSPFTN